MRSIRPINIEREILLFEIARRCTFPNCNERNFIGLTKSEALAYTGFECCVCERWNSDDLREADTPEWWDEISSDPKTAH